MPAPHDQRERSQEVAARAGLARRCGTRGFFVVTDARPDVCGRTYSIPPDVGQLQAINQRQRKMLPVVDTLSNRSIQSICREKFPRKRMTMARGVLSACCWKSTDRREVNPVAFRRTPSSRTENQRWTLELRGLTAMTMCAHIFTTRKQWIHLGLSHHPQNPPDFILTFQQTRHRTDCRELAPRWA